MILVKSSTSCLIDNLLCKCNVTGTLHVDALLDSRLVTYKWCRISDSGVSAPSLRVPSSGVPCSVVLSMGKFRLNNGRLRTQVVRLRRCGRSNRLCRPSG